MDALLASGRLERVHDREIRAHLSKWPDWLEDIHTNDLAIRDFSFREIAPYLADHGIPRQLCPEGEWWCVLTDAVPEDYVALADDPKLKALLLFRRGMMLMSADDHEEALAEAQDLLELIRARLTVLGD